MKNIVIIYKHSTKMKLKIKNKMMMKFQINFQKLLNNKFKHK